MSRTMLMTGASRGIGRSAAERMLSTDPALHLVVLARGDTASTLPGELARVSGNPNVTAVRADLAALADVQRAAAEVGAAVDSGDLPPLSGIVANAGLQLTSTTGATADGIE